MTARTHDLAAITVLAAVVLSQPPRTVTLGTALVAVLANQLGGIAPDIDQPTAPFWRNVPVGHVLGKIITKGMGGHRFLTHSLLGMALAGFLVHTFLLFLQPVMPKIDIGLIWWAFMIGMLSHLVLDSFTKEGVPWLLPLPWKLGFPPLRRLRVTTGKMFELAVLFPGLVAFDIWFCAVHYHTLLVLLHRHIV